MTPARGYNLDDPDDLAAWRARSPGPYPSLPQQAANLAAAAARFVSSGLAIVEPDEYARRRAICEACPTGKYDAEQVRCRSCGCSLAVKPWSKAERCPDGHW